MLTVKQIKAARYASHCLSDGNGLYIRLGQFLT